MAIFDILDSTILINFLFPICPKCKNCSTNNPGEGVGNKKKRTKNFKKIIQRRYGNGKKDVLDFTGNVNWH
jgi:hypothetical protein